MPKCLKVKTTTTSFYHPLTTNINLRTLISEFVAPLSPAPFISGEVAILQIPENGSRGWTLIVDLPSFPNLCGAVPAR